MAGSLDIPFFTTHTNNVTVSLFHLCNISRLCTFLSQHSIQVLVQALVTPNLDYSNAILSHLLKNSKARIITCTKFTDHIAPIQLGSPFPSASSTRLCFSLLKLSVSWHPHISSSSFTLTPHPVLYAQPQELS